MTNNDLIPRKEVDEITKKIIDAWYFEDQDLIEKLKAELSQIESVSTEKVTRVEVIDEHWRVWTTYNAENVNFDFQDDSKTLKVFLKSNKPIESVNGWIDVKERKPEEYERVLIFTWSEILLAKLVYDSEWHYFKNYWWDRILSYPTHWMPLPPSPYS